MANYVAKLAGKFRVGIGTEWMRARNGIVLEIDTALPWLQDRMET